MRINYTYLLILFLISDYCYSQTVIDIEADFVAFNYPSSLVFYKKTGSDLFSITQFSAEKVNENYLIKSETTPFIKTLRNHDSIIEVKKLPNNTLKELEELLLNKKFIKQVDINDRGKNTSYIHLVKAESNLLFSSTMYEVNPGEVNPDRRYNGKIFLNYFFIRLNQKKMIMILTSNANPQVVTGFYIPTKSSTIFSYDRYGSRTSTPFEGLTESQILLPDSIDFKDDINYWSNVQYRIDENMLKDILSSKSLIKRRFDTLYHNYPFLIGEKKDTTFIYNKKLEEITPKNLRKIHFQNDNELYSRDLQILVGNKIKWLNAAGELKDETNPIIRRICGTGMPYFNLELTKKEGYYYLNNTKAFTKDTYDKAYFLNGSNSISGIGSLSQNFLIVKKNNKYGLLLFRTNHHYNEIETEEVLPVKYDSIKLSGGSILLQQNGLYGYFTINNELKYKSIEPFNRYFARFTMPDGQKGWLDEDGNEYPDI